MSSRLSKKISETRRQFLAATVSGLFVAGTGSLASGVGTSQPQLRVRKSALELPPNDPIFTQYADAVKKMHALPPGDPRSWRNQCEIHPNHCSHGTPSFFPWHRHYINQFEKICGRLIGDDTFALPYWDWTVQGGKVPDALFDIQELNVAYWKDNGVGNFPGNWGAVDSQGIRAVVKGQRIQDDPNRGGNFTANRIDQIKQSPTYSILRQQVEGVPHNSGHVVVGLDARRPWGHMVDGLSPLDPLFWMHHCNVDRIWAEWQLAGNSTPPFNVDYNRHFVNADGGSIDVTADDAIDFERLGFNYDTINTIGTPREFIGVARLNVAAALVASTAAPAELTTISSAPVSEPIAVNAPFSLRMPTADLAARTSERHNIRNAFLPSATIMNSVAGGPESAIAAFGQVLNVGKRVYALIENGRSRSAVPPSVGVFLNCPYLAPGVPYTDRHFAGSFSFFGHKSPGHHGHGDHEGQDFLVDITEAVESLGAARAENITVQLLPTAPSIDGAPTTIEVAGIKILTLPDERRLD